MHLRAKLCQWHVLHSCIALATAQALTQFLPTLLLAASLDSIREIQMVRCSLGTYLVFALELMIVSDLLHSVLSERIEDLVFLAAIVVIRTVIAYFLNQEIQELVAAS